MKPARNRRGGWSLIELTISVAMLAMLVITLTNSLVGLRRGSLQTNIDAELQEVGQQALRSIVADLRRSGFATVGGSSYPYLFLDGNATGAYVANRHPAATHTAVAGDPDFGPTREIVFVQPADADANGRPDVGANGLLVWNAAQFSYVLVTRADGVNVLQRRLGGANGRPIAHHVERVAFDDSTTDAQVPVRAIRVRIWLRRFDERRALHAHFTEAVVNLRNG